MPGFRDRTDSGGSSAGGFRRSSGGGGFRSRPTTSTKKKGGGNDWMAMLSPPLYLLEKSGIGGRWGRGIAHAGEAINALPLSVYFMAKHPKRTLNETEQTILGMGELPYGLYKMHHKGMSWTDIGHMMLKSTVNDYKRRYGANWQQAADEDPLSNFFDLLSVLGLGARGAATAGAMGRLAEAGIKEPGLVKIWKEANRPGIISKGEAIPRELRFHPETGKGIFSTQEWSRSPLRRATQEIIDTLSEKYGEAPVFGARARIGRANANQLRRFIDRALGGIENVGALNSLSDAERSRLFWGAQMGDHSAQALRTVKAVLADEYHNHVPEAEAGFNDFLHSAKQAGFGDALLKRVQAAIDVAEKDDFHMPAPDTKYGKALKAMQDATKLSEDVIRDSDGFTTMRNDLRRAEDQWARLEDKSTDQAQALEEEIHQLHQALTEKSANLDAMFSDRRARPRDWILSRAAANSPIRKAWEEDWTNRLGPQQAADALDIHDRISFNYQHGPVQWWEDRMGKPGQETPEDLAGREAAAQYQDFGPYGTTPLIEGDAMDPAATSAFYAPLQREIADNWPPSGKPIPPVELRGKLRNAVPEEQWANSGLDMFFEDYINQHGNAPVHQEDLQRWLGTPMNNYNLREHHLSNSAEAKAAGYGAIYDDRQLLSRDPAEGEYHELIYEVPNPRTTYRGEGWEHWGEGRHDWGSSENIAFHMRLQDFEEGGVRKLVKEELQSDHADEYRKSQTEEAKAAHEEFLKEYEGRIQNLSDEEKNRYLDMEAQQENLIDEQMDLGETLQALEEDEGYDLRNTPIESLPDDVRTNLLRYDSITQQLDDIEGEMGRLLPSMLAAGPTPSPWGANRYIRTAARRLIRYAKENGTDEIILVDPTVQHLRNSPYMKELTLDALGKSTNEETRAILDTLTKPVWKNLYAKKFKQILDEELGVEGIVKDDAYQGRYTGQMYGDSESIVGPMRATVWKVTDDVLAKGERSQSLYQRQPDWKVLPRGVKELKKGATEKLADGRTRVHLFKGADISTVLHELAHVALGDLSEEQLATLGGHYAGGKHYLEWLDSEHENFARDFETYWHEGVAPKPELEPIFKRIAEWMKEVFKTERRTNPDALSSDVGQVFDQMLGRHEPDVFIPHRPGSPNLTGARTSRGIPRAQREIGDFAYSRIPMFKHNTLALMKSGMISDDPRQLIEHVNRGVMLARANQLREAVIEMAEPLEPGTMPNFATQYVVKKAGRGVDRPLYDALENADSPEEMGQTLKDYIDKNLGGRDLWEEWNGKTQLYVVDKKVVDNLFKNVTGKTPGATTKPITTAGKVGDAVLDGIRGLLLYANPGFYVANMVGNGMMTALNDPRAFKDLAWSMKEASKAAYHEEDASHLWHRITVEMGRGPTSGGLSFKPSVLGREGGYGAERFSHSLGNWGRRSGRVIDDSWRVMAWKAAARKRGYKTDAEIRKLLDDADSSRKSMTQANSKSKRDLNSIRDEAEQLMLDFDSMTPFERTYLTRIVFLYPFLKASAKYPLMFAGERPITAGALGQAGLIGEQLATSPEALGPRDPNLPTWMQMASRGPGGYWNIGSVAPYAAGLNMVESLLGVGQAPEVGIQRPFDYLNPLYQMAIDMSQGRTKFGQAQPWYEIMRQEFPAPGYIRYAWKRPSNIYAERDWWNTLLRSARGPFTVNQQAALEQATRGR